MAAAPRALFVTDLDGTLLGPDRELGAGNRAAIAAASAAGVVVAVVTGRRRSSFAHDRDRLDGLAYRLATSNGAVVLGPDNHRPEAVFPLAWELVDAVRRWPEARGLELACITAPDGHDAGGREPPDCFVVDVDSGRHQLAPSPFHRDDWTPVDAALARARPWSTPPSASRTATRPTGSRRRRRHGSGHRLASRCAEPGRPRSADGAGAEGGKGLALDHLRRALGIAAAATAAIGDELNDCDLLDAACHRFAVGGSVLARHRPDAVEVAPAAAGAVAAASTASSPRSIGRPVTALGRAVDRLPLAVAVVLCLTLGLAPYRPPHVVEKLRLLASLRLERAIDVFDLVLHGSPWLLLAVKVAQMAGRRSTRASGR